MGPVTAVQLRGADPEHIRNQLSTTTLATANTDDTDSSTDCRGIYKTRIDRIF